MNIVIIGSSGHARVIIDILEQEAKYRIVGLLDSYKPPDTELLGYRVFGTEEDLPALLAARVCDGGIVAIGDNWARASMIAKIRQLAPEFRFISAIHPSACIARDVRVGRGTAVMAMAVVNTGSRIGEFCILNTRCSIDHECVLGDFSSLAPGAVTGGRVQIGAYSVVAIGAIILHDIKIGEHTVIGAGATVIRDVPDHVVAYGVPARVIRPRKPGDPYLREARQPMAEPETTPVRRSVCNFPDLKLIPPTSEEWNACIDRTRHDFFHFAGYHQLAEQFGNGEAWIAVYGTRDRFVAWPYLLQKIEDSGRDGTSELRDVTSVYGYTGPIEHGCGGDHAFCRSAAQAFVNLWQSQQVVSVFTRFHPLLRNHELLDELEPSGQSGICGSPYPQGNTVAIETWQSPEEVRHRYTRQLRQALRHCEQSGLHTEPDPNWDGLDDFVRLYYQTMNRNSASPAYFFPKQYFQKLKVQLGSMGILMLARVEGEVAAAALVIEYKGVANVHLLATEHRFAHLSPSKQIIDVTQAWARDRGDQHLFLGGGRANRDDDPLFRFKAQFSRTFFPFFTGRWILDANSYEWLSQKRRREAEALRGKQVLAGFFPAYRSPWLTGSVLYHGETGVNTPATETEHGK